MRNLFGEVKALVYPLAKKIEIISKENKNMIIDYKNQEQMKELGFRISKEYGRVYVSVDGDFESVTFINFPTITTDGMDFKNCTFESTQLIEFSQAKVQNCTFRNVSEISGHFTDFSGCTFVQCCAQGPLLTIDNVGSIEGCTFETITALGDDGYIIYSVYGKKKDVREIKHCKFIDCEVGSEDGELVYCCYFKPLRSSKTVDIDNVDYGSCVFDDEK
jgi:hypothetical protein